MAGKQIVWTGNGTIEIGSAGAPVDFAIGFLSAAAPVGDVWTGAVNNLWTTGGNWFDGSAPTAADFVNFTDLDDGGTNIVNQNFAISSLYYTGAGGHTTQVNGGRTLNVAGPVGIGSNNPDNEVSLSGSGNVAAFFDTLYIARGGSGNVTANMDLSLMDFEVDVSGSVRIANKISGNGSGTQDGALKLGSNSVFSVGTAVAPAEMRIGFNEDSNDGNSIGVFDALETGADVNLHLSTLVVGNSNGGAATGTLRWNQSEVIDADAVWFGVGGTGILEVPTGGTLKLGTAADPINNLNIARVGSGNALADLDFSVTDPFFEAHVGGFVRIANKISGNGSGTQDGTLKLGSNSVFNVGTAVAPAEMRIGFNEDSNDGNSIGVFDASEGTTSWQRKF